MHPGDLNATPAIVRSVVLYVLRLLLPDPLPLNEGLMRAVSLELPEGILNPPFPEAPRPALLQAATRPWRHTCRAHSTWV